jgi:hypothetical protein
MASVRWLCITSAVWVVGCEMGRSMPAPEEEDAGWEGDAGGSGVDAGPIPDAGGASDASVPFLVAPHHLFPQLPRHGTAILAPMRLVTIVSANEALAARLEAFGAALVKSQWYRTVGNEYGLGAAGPALSVTGPAIAAGTPSAPIGFTDAQVQKYIAGVIQAHASLTPDGRTVYLLYLPDGVTSPVGTNLNADCSAGAGHHASSATISTLNDGYAVVQRCPTYDPVEYPPEQLLTIIASHEVVEAATDPMPETDATYQLWLPLGTSAWLRSPWIEIEGAFMVEVGDLCMSDRTFEGGFAYQRIFSDAAAAQGSAPCLPTPASPYYSVTAPQEWYVGAAGQQVEIPLTGWSTGPRGDWVVQAIGNNASSDATYRMRTTLQSATNITAGGVSYATTNNGIEMPLQVQMPVNAPSGWWGTIVIYSFDVDANGYTPAGEDFGHTWTVGVRVP